MAYRAKHIEDFINKVNEEAEKAAQAIYDKHQAKLNELIANQVLKGHKLICGNGTAIIIKKGEEHLVNYRNDYAEKFLQVLTDMQYNKPMAGFDVIDVDKRC